MCHRQGDGTSCADENRRSHLCCCELDHMGEVSSISFRLAACFMSNMLCRAELNAGLFAASLPPLKSTFENILRRCGVMTGLTTPGNTYQSGEYGRSRTFRSGARASNGYTLGDNSQSNYGLSSLKNHSQRDGESLEEDQKHILKTGMDNNGEWITKTTEYSISHDVMSNNRRL